MLELEFLLEYCITNLIYLNSETCRADIESKDEHDRTALHYTVAKHDIAIVKLLLDRGADIESKGEDSCTVLHFAVEQGNSTSQTTA